MTTDNYQLKYHIHQYNPTDFPELKTFQWAHNFTEIYSRYSSKPIIYPVVFTGINNQLIACGSVIFENKTAWIGGLASAENDFPTELEMLSHLTDFCNSMLLDNILSIIPFDKQDLFENCGYTPSEILQKWSIPNIASTLSDDNLIDADGKDVKKAYRFITDIINEKRELIWNSNDAPLIYKQGKYIEGVLLKSELWPVYAQTEAAATALLNYKAQYGPRTNIIPDDNLQGKQMLQNLGAHMEKEYLRMSLGKDNRWKKHQIFSSFSHFCC